MIRAYDWAASPLGAPEDWPQVLHVLIDLMLTSSQPMFIVWGPERTLFYNDAYVKILAAKHPALGLPFEEVWHEIWERDLKPIVARAYAGEALHMDDIPLMMLRHGYLEETHFSFSYTPVSGPGGSVQGFLCPCLEITEQVLDERRAKLRVELNEKFRTLRDPVAVSREAAALLARHLGVEQGAYAEIDETGDSAQIESDWNDGSIPSCAGHHRLQDFGEELIADLKQGHSVVISDVREDPRTCVPATLEAFAQRRIRSFMDIPYIRDGRLVAVLALHSVQTKHWHPGDVALAEEVAQRTHAAVEGARSAAAQRVSDQQLRETRDALALATKASSLGWATWDFVTDAVNLDACGREIMGFGDGVVTISKWLEHIHPEDRTSLDREFGNCLRENRPFDLEYRVCRPDGALRHVHGTGIFQATAEGDPLQGTGFVRDVTDRKRSEQRQNMLMAELDHRVKNILAVVQSIARQSLARSHEAGAEAADRLVGRISALAQSHSLLAQSRWEGACFEVLVENAVAPYRGDEPGRILIDGPGLRVTPKAAQILTLALHELVTNAAKYGALSRREGRVSARWHLSGEGQERRLIVVWREMDGPPIEGAPQRKGFGSVLIERMLTSDLGGQVTLDYAQSGLRAEIDLPLENLRAESGQTERSFSPARPLTGDRTSLTGKRVLVVEDEHLVSQETIAALEGAGCVVVGPASTMSEALKMVVTEEFDAAVLDVNLNGTRVWPAAQVLQARGIPFAFATGYSDIIDIPAELAKERWIEKPLDTDRLLQTVAAVFADRVAPQSDETA
ncbi:HWE histidine kinase domain-containing protein [uncultured Limimaricola sp.]|uniref:HWE histidine kinase domain-containing protein n=1 Tax=uncultured Limimaricola sp. TaxID=2211667 RepID=UPI0030FA1076